MKRIDKSNDTKRLRNLERMAQRHWQALIKIERVLKVEGDSEQTIVFIKELMKDTLQRD